MHNPLSEIGKQIVLGSMMGDGYLMMNPTTRHARLEITHDLASKDYIEWKYQHLSVLCGSGLRAYTKMRNTTPCHRLRFRTLGHSMFTRLHHYCYPRGVRVASGKLLNSLDAVGLAVWWMDDGNLCLRHKPTTISRTCDLHIERYSPACCDVIRRWFADRFGIVGKLCVHYFSHVQKRPLLYFRFSVYDAYHILRPYLAPIVEQIPSMRRKLDFQFAEGKTPQRGRIDNPGQSAHQVVRTWLRKHPSLLDAYQEAWPV